MKMKDVFRLSDNESVLYFTLNWFDLAPETQAKILEKAKQEMGLDNIFSFPNIEVRLLVERKEI